MTLVPVYYIIMQYLYVFWNNHNKSSQRTSPYGVTKIVYIVMRTFKNFSFSNFQIRNTVLSMRVTMPYVTDPGLTNFPAESSYLSTPFTPFTQAPTLTTASLFSVTMSFGVFVVVAFFFFKELVSVSQPWWLHTRVKVGEGRDSLCSWWCLIDAGREKCHESFLRICEQCLTYCRLLNIYSINGGMLSRVE